MRLRQAPGVRRHHTPVVLEDATAVEMREARPNDPPSSPTTGMSWLLISRAAGADQARSAAAKFFQFRKA
jgi:hypothetical protein